ncbi:MAG: hypothetical protein J6B01_04925 [Ruminococcus sp.]|nr:hypothetical protein [Ruminococcus sp.]MBO5319135.1 hypothetical protein [Ruminococcus sp.]
MNYLIILLIAIPAAIFLVWVLNSEYDKCYSRMEYSGYAAMGSCGRLVGGTPSTEYLSESCIGCPYLVLECKKKGETHE